MPKLHDDNLGTCAKIKSTQYMYDFSNYKVNIQQVGTKTILSFYA